MYQDYKGASYSDKLQLNWEQIRPQRTYTNLSLHTDKYSNHKSIRWNIEESKENLMLRQNQDYPSRFNKNTAQQAVNYQNNSVNPKKQRHYQPKDYSKTWGTKSYKTIKFSDQTAYQNQFTLKDSHMAKDCKQSKPKCIDLKGLMITLGQKSNLRDFFPKNTEQKSKDDKKFGREAKNLKSCRSQKKIKTEFDKFYEPHQQSNVKNQYFGSKSCKKLTYSLSCLKLKDKQDQSIAPLVEHKRDQFKMKSYKTLSYKDRANAEPYFKTKLTIQSEWSKQPSSKKHGISISQFQLGTCKGQGAFGQVFPAIHKATKMIVAIKKVPKDKVKYMLDQFINQVKIQMFLDHPNIVKLYSFFDDAIYFYIVMEYMQGGSLFSHIKKNKKISTEETAIRLKQVCLGLKQMHNNSILHRDIKPQNIVITNDVCKLCDFGWSTVCKDRRTTYCGTLDYISPEIVGGEGYDDSVDIWCVGVLAYQMICGKTPFYNISRTQTMKKIMNVKYQYPPELTSKAKSFIDKILKKNPEDRLGIEQVLKDNFLDQ